MRIFQIGARMSIYGRKYWHDKNQDGYYDHEEKIFYGKKEYIVPKFKKHGLDIILSDKNFILNYFIKGEILKDIPSPYKEKFGDFYPKNIQNRLAVFYEFDEKNVISIISHKDLKNEKVMNIIANRIAYFLENSPFVLNFIEKKSENEYSFKIEYI